MKLRQHQIEALNAIENSNEGIIHLPTGSGKTYIESYAISNNIDAGFKHQEIPVFVILAPRIILCNQLYNVIKETLLLQKKDCHYLIVHSGKTVDDTKRMWTVDLPFRQLTSTTSYIKIAEEYEKARLENVPLIIFGTYDSSERIMDAQIPVYMTLCDEAQYLVSKEFSWICLENEVNAVKQFNSLRKYYFTATLKETFSDKGLGMNNSDLFGPIIYEKTPLEMIIAGEILRPRLQFTDLENKNDEDVYDKIDIDVNAIKDAFIKHKMNCNNGAKLLVVTGGSEDLNKYVTHPKMQKFLALRDNLKIFDISSAFSPRINGEVVRREKFLEELQGMDDKDDAIIFHINILSEGIDVPGITGIMPMNTMTTGKFLQTLGRASRLQKDDRKNLYSGVIKYDDLEDFKKPYAWIIVPCYGIIGEDLTEKIQSIIEALRETGFDASEDVEITYNNGHTVKIPLAGTNVADIKVKALFDVFVSIQHNIEEKEIADKIAIEDFRLEEKIKNMSDEEVIKFS